MNGPPELHQAPQSQTWARNTLCGNQRMISVTPISGESARFHFSDYRLAAHMTSDLPVLRPQCSVAGESRFPVTDFSDQGLQLHARNAAELKLLAQCGFQEFASSGVEQASYEMKLIWYLPLNKQPITLPSNA